MNKILLFLLMTTAVFCYTNETIKAEDFKCSLPEVKTVDNNLDVGRFLSDFAKISEVKFPGLIGPASEQLICKIKCIDGNWVGPLCSLTPRIAGFRSMANIPRRGFQHVGVTLCHEPPCHMAPAPPRHSTGILPRHPIATSSKLRKTPFGASDGRFQPVFRECLYRNQNPLLAVAYKKDSILMDTYFPHGSVITARCKHFGLYKLTGDNVLKCENGEWSSKMPQCVPTSVITNYTNDSPPTIQYVAATGSAIVELTGELYVYPGSTLWLDCLWPQSLGKPEWSWTQLYRHYAAWASASGETGLHYRLVLNRVSARHSDSYTCTSPAGHTNTVAIKVVNIVCPPINVSSPHVHQFAQGTRLGNAVHFSCQPGYHLNGSSIVNCMGDGRWSSQPPTCVETFCPMLRTLGNHLSVVEYNSSYGGRAVFACSWGYRLIGAPGLECELDGRWSGEMPHCIPIYCPDPLVPEQGRLLAASSRDGKYPVGDLIIYSCEDGYEIVGESSIVCTENGFWSHPPPFCLPPSEIRKSDTIYIDNTTLVNFEE